MSVRTIFFGAALSITVVCVVAPDCAAQVFSASSNLQNTTITNKSGYDLGAIDIDAADGAVVGTVYMSKSMTFGDDQRPIKGPGTIAGRGSRSSSCLRASMPQCKRRPSCAADCHHSRDHADARERAVRQRRHPGPCCRRRARRLLILKARLINGTTPATPKISRNCSPP